MIFRKKASKVLLPTRVSGSQETQPVVTTPRPFDIYLFFTTLMLVFIGIVMIFSSSAILAKERFGDTYYFLKRELLYFVIGLTALFVTKRIPYQIYTRYVYPVLGVTVVLMALCFVPGLSHEVGGASRWIRFGGFSLQPSEWAKLSVILFAAYLISKKGEKIRLFAKGYIPIILISGLFILMILGQKDLGSAVVLGLVIFIMLFVSGTRVHYIVGSISLALPALYFLIFSVSFRRKRILAFLDPWKYQMDQGFQVIQSFVAFKTGGLLGVGLGASKQKLFYLPEAHTDFIFSVFGEEFGLVGVLFVIALFILFVYRGMAIALKTQDAFGKFLAFGITTLIGVQTIINLGVVMGLLPTKGLALPFISYGGSSLVASLAAVGILLNVSTQAEEE
jgi:cell division protein FtsW